MAETMLWNVEHSASMKASRIREFDIVPYRPIGDAGEMFELKGWLTSQEFFRFGDFKTERAAQEYLQKLHGLIEGTAGVDYSLLTQCRWGPGEVSRHTFTLYDRDVEILKRLSDQLGVKKSVLIRYLISALDRDM